MKALVSVLRYSALLVSMMLLSCSDDSTAPPAEPPVDNLTRQGANATSATIGPEGGAIVATADDGTVYTLTVPADALASGKKITVTPLTKIKGYPIADGMAAGAELSPSGLVFAAPVTLEIQTAKTPGAGLTPVAMVFTGNGEAFQPSLIGSGSGTFTIPMTHFSGGTAGFATAQELEHIAATTGAPLCLFPAIDASHNSDLSELFSIYRSCFASDVLPAIQNASNDTQLAMAIGQFSMWKIESRDALGPALFSTFDDIAETVQAYDALIGKLQAAIDRNNQRCGTNESLASLANVLFWQAQAHRFGLDSVANLLDRDHVLSSLCARPVVDNLVIPSNLDVGFPYSMDIQFGLLFSGHQDSQGVPFHVELSGDGINIQHASGFTDAQGKYTTVITPTRDGDLFITAKGCMVYPGTTTTSDVCVEETGGTNANNLDGQWGGSFSGSHTGNISMTLNQNQNAIDGTFQVCGSGAGTFGISATLSQGQLLGVTMVFSNSLGCSAPRNTRQALGGCVAQGTGTVVDADHVTIHVANPVCDCGGNVDVTVTLTRDNNPCP